MTKHVNKVTRWTDEELSLAESVAFEILREKPDTQLKDLYPVFLTRVSAERREEKLRNPCQQAAPRISKIFRDVRDLIRGLADSKDEGPDGSNQEEEGANLAASPPPYGDSGSSAPVPCRWEWTEDEKKLVYERALAYAKEHPVLRKNEIVEYAQALLPLHRRKRVDQLDDAADRLFRQVAEEAEFTKPKLVVDVSDEPQNPHDHDELSEAVSTSVRLLVDEVRRTVAQQVADAKDEIIAAVLAALDAKKNKAGPMPLAPSVREAVKSYLPAAPTAKAKAGPRICVVSHQAHGLKQVTVPEGVTVEWKDTDKPHFGSVRGFDFVVFMPGHRGLHVDSARSQLGREKVITLSTAGMSYLAAELARLTAKWRYNQSHGVRPEKEKT